MPNSRPRRFRPHRPPIARAFSWPSGAPRRCAPPCSPLASPSLQARHVPAPLGQAPRNRSDPTSRLAPASSAGLSPCQTLGLRVPKGSYRRTSTGLRHASSRLPWPRGIPRASLPPDFTPTRSALQRERMQPATFLLDFAPDMDEKPRLHAANGNRRRRGNQAGPSTRQFARWHAESKINLRANRPSHPNRAHIGGAPRSDSHAPE